MSGTVGPRIAIPSFLNQYSYNFDGVNDVIREEALSFIPPPVISISVWVKTDFTTGGDTTNIGYIVTKDNVSSARDIILNYRGTGTNKLSFVFWSPSGVLSSIASPTFPLGNPTDGNWHHILATWDGTTDANKIQLFVDGSLIAQATANDTGIRNSTTTNLTIGGADTATNTRLFYGNIDEITLFNTDQSANVAEIYNGGVPKDLTDLSPMTWYRMGENATWRDPQWLIPSNENKDKVSNYSMAFDGANDYVDCGVVNQVQTFSYSMWVNPLNWSATRVAIQQGSSSNYGVSFWFMSDGTLRCLGSNGTNDSYFGNVVVNADTYLTSGDWGHILFTHEQTGTGATQKIYINGILRNTYVSTTNPYIVNYLGNPLYIGKRNNNTAFFQGNIGAVALFDNDQSLNATAIYNGGTPTDLTSLNPISYWKSDNATFDGSNWTIVDNAGSNDGTSANMTLSDRLGDAPNSINNVLSLNMVEVDRETDVPT